MSHSPIRQVLAVAVATLTAACAHAQQQPAAPRTPFDSPQSVALATPIVTVPLQKEGPFYFAEVRLNGRPFRFTVETGAGFFGISTAAARSLGLRIDTISVEGVAQAGSARMPVTMLDSVSLGGATFRNVSARVTSMWGNAGFDGIVSTTLLRDLLATYDLGAAQIILERGSLPEPNGRDVLPLAKADRGGRMDVVIDIGGVTTPAVFDTRSFIWITLPDSLEPRLRLENPPRAIGSAAGPSMGSFDMRGARLAGDARIGGSIIQRPALTFRNRPGTVLGAPLMEQYRITFDQRNGRVRMQRPPGSPVTIPALAWETTGGTTSAPGNSTATGNGTVSTNAPRTLGFNLAGYPGSNRLRIVNLVPLSDAEKVGLRNDDELVELDGTPVAQMNPLVARAVAAKGTPFRIVVTRDGKQLTFTVMPYTPR